jgi:hypothetical protein
VACQAQWRGIVRTQRSEAFDLCDRLCVRRQYLLDGYVALPAVAIEPNHSEQRSHSFRPRDRR